MCCSAAVVGVGARAGVGEIVVRLQFVVVVVEDSPLLARELGISVVGGGVGFVVGLG